jgi:palmitoyltransferase
MKIKWKLPQIIPKKFAGFARDKFNYFCLCIKSLTFNIHLNQSYASDVLLEPIFWFVDNFASFLGPFFLVAVTILTFAVVYISYWIGLPYWWEKSPIVTIFLLIFGNYLLVNVIFHYYMAVVTSPGVPPQEVIFEAVSICKKCISPKPERTHHCSVCNRCVLKLDHHCPWLNNCVGESRINDYYTSSNVVFGFRIWKS